MEMEAFELRRLSKIDLHRHLDCSVRWSTFVELLKVHQISLPKENEEILKKFLVTEPMHDLPAVLQKFLSLQQVFSSTDILTRVGFEAVEDAYNDGIVKIEFRYAPTFIREKFPQLSFDQIHQALLEGIQLAAAKFPIQAGLIIILQRIKDEKTNDAVADFIISHKDSIVGIDLADDESAAPAGKFQTLFSKLRSRTNLPITIHAGEVMIPEAEKSFMDAIELLGARRIGHGVQIFRFPQLMKKVKENNIHLEVCPISNYLTKAFPDFKSHSLPVLYNEGISLSINSDDPGMFGTTLTDEFVVCQKYYGFRKADFEKIFSMANKASFIKKK